MAERPGDEDLHGCDGDGDDGFAGHACARPDQGRPKEEARKTEEKKPEVDEKAYKAALERIPGFQGKIRPVGRRTAGRTRQEGKISRTGRFSRSGLEPWREHD
jgi:hypothetical protein